MSVFLFFCSFQFHIVIHRCYYFSLNELPWQNASNFCNKFCNSELVSIDSNEKYEDILKFLDNYSQYIHNDVWIGLYRNPPSTDSFTWIDNTSFNFGNNISTGAFPWRYDEPDHASANQNCVELYHIDFVFNDEWCTETNNFVCDSCDGIITKYIGHGVTYYTHSNSNIECLNKYNTTVASIHSDIDFNEIRLIAIERNRNYWIGLYDKYVNYNFTWYDGTTFDYGNNISIQSSLNSKSEYPWSVSDPDPVNDGQHCVFIDVLKDYRWNDGDCNEGMRVLCNMPSELCYKNQWISLYDYPLNLHWSLCQLRIVFNNSETKNVIVLKNKQWITNDIDKPLIIEYMFSMRSISYPYSGIIIYYNHQCTDYVEIGISFDAIRLIGSDSAFVIKYLNDSEYILIDIYYRLKIEIYKTKQYIISINDEIYINKTLNMNITDKKLSGFIGIFGNNTIINAKYLFVSGESIYINNTNWFMHCLLTNDPTDIPTNIPTNIPTMFPTINPTVIPLNPSYPTNIPTKLPSSNPINIPTVSPNIYPTIIETIVSQSFFRSTTLISESMVDTRDDNSDNILTFILIIIGSFLLICVIGIICYLFLMKNKIDKTNDDEKIISSQLQMADNNNVKHNSLVVKKDDAENIQIIGEEGNELENEFETHSTQFNGKTTKGENDGIPLALGEDEFIVHDEFQSTIK